MLGAIVGSLMAVLSYANFGILGLTFLSFVAVATMLRFRDTRTLKEMAYAIGALVFALLLSNAKKSLNSFMVGGTH